MNGLDPRTKITFVLAVSLLSITLDHLTSLGLLALVSFTAFLKSGPKGVQLKGALLFLSLTVWGVIFSQGIFYQRFPRSILFSIIPGFECWGWHFNGLHIYRQGLFYGLVQSLRFVAASSAGLALCLTTSSQGLFKALAGLRVPYSLSFLAVIAVRFLPIIAEEMLKIRRAMKLKGYRPFKAGLKHTVRTEISAVLPLLAATMRRSREIAESLLTRGFDPLGKRSVYKQTTWPLKERFLAGLLTSLALCAAWVRFLFWLYENNIYYNSFLRPLYSAVRFYF